MCDTFEFFGKITGKKEQACLCIVIVLFCSIKLLYRAGFGSQRLILIILFYLYQKSKTYFISWCMIAVNLTLLCCAPLDFAGDSFIVETEVEMSVEASVISSVKSSLISSGP